MPIRLGLLVSTTFLVATSTACRLPPVKNDLGLGSQAFAQLTEHLASRDSVRVRGTFREVVIRHPKLTADSLLAPPDGSGVVGPRFGLRDVTSIQVRGGASGTGAMVGAGVGFAGGLAVALGMSASLCSSGGCRNETGGTAVITMGSTAVGALLGALMGATFRKWNTVYRAR